MTDHPRRCDEFAAGDALDFDAAERRNGGEIMTPLALEPAPSPVATGLSATLSAGAIRTACARLRGVVDGDSGIPILRCAMIRAGDGGAAIEGTDLDRTLTVDLPARVARPGAVCVDLRALSRIARALDRTAEITLSDCGDAVRLSDGASEWTPPCRPVGDWPELPFAPAARFTLPAGDMARMFGAALYAVSREETRYCLNGVYLNNRSDGALTAVATDGYRMAHATAALPEGAGGVSVIVPTDASRDLARLTAATAKDGGDLSVETAPLKMRVSGPGWRLTTNTIDGTYPDYQRAIPRLGVRVATFDRNAMRAALRRVVAVVGSGSGAVTLDVGGDPGRIDMHMSGDDGACATASTPCENAGPPHRVGFDARLLAATLSQVRGARVAMHGPADDAPRAPRVFCVDGDGGGGLHVLMPVRV